MFGLIAESHVDFSLPRVRRKKQVEIVSGAVHPRGTTLFESAEPTSFGCYRNGDAVFLAWEHARFSVIRDRVVVDADHREAAEHVLVPAVWSVVLAAHHRESLHGSAVEWNGCGIAVLGRSGSGKSTAARALIERGWRLVSDDLLTFDDELRVVPGPPWMRFSPRSVWGSSRIVDAGGKVRVDSPTSSSPISLSAMVIMDPAFGRCFKLSGMSAVAALLRQVYNPVLTHGGQAERRFELIHALADRVPVYAAPPRSLSADQLVDLVNGGTR